MSGGKKPSAAYATLTEVSETCYHRYRIYFSALVRRALLQNVTGVLVFCTDKYIVIEPVNKENVCKEQMSHFTSLCLRPDSATLNVTRIVYSDGLIRRDYFGKRYKVKKDKRGRIYICLEEPYEKEDKR